MKKYLFVTPTLSNGGAERVISVLASSLAATRHVCVVKYYVLPNEYPIDIRVKTINLFCNKEECEKTSFLGKVLKLRAVFKKESPDYIIPFTFLIALPTSFASVGLKTSIIQSMRIDPASAPKSKTRRRIRDFLVYKSKCSFVQNEKQRHYFKEKYRNKIHVLYNPVSEEMLNITPVYDNNIYTICSVGRLEKQKNFKLLIDSFENAFVGTGNVVLRIFGEGSCHEELNDYIQGKGLQNRVYLMGRSNNIAEVLRQASLFVLSSDFEGMPNALIEAMACGLPCVSTDCPTGPSDLIDNMHNGLLVKVSDVNSMSDGLRFMFDNPIHARQMGVAAKRTIEEKCKADNIAKQMISICESFK